MFDWTQVVYGRGSGAVNSLFSTFFSLLLALGATLLTFGFLSGAADVF